MVGRTLAHYQVLEKLGEGGMGVVYKARDTHLDRFVAIKVLPPERVADPERKRRFVQEAKAASALNHPNIIHIYDIDQQQGLDFIAMEYVPGKTLDQLIPRKGMRVNEALKHGIQIADALSRAHAAGIVHRDLKPSNIMVTDDSLVKLLDFGLAKLTEPATLGEDESTRTLKPQTEKGTIVGTVAYMSPEQAQGRPVDARSDIFSLGTVLYEMVTGRRAFQGASAISVLAAILRDEPVPLRAIVADAPAELEKIVTRCLRKEPEERFQSATQLKGALEKACSAREEAQPTPPSIAVLPFVNLSPDKENEYFSDGLAEEIINALTRQPGLRVTARTSAFSFRGKDLDASEIGSRLKVGHILEGSVRKAGNRIRVTAQLVNVADGYHLWSERFDREMTDVFAIQDEISQAIVDKLRVRLVSEGRLVKRHTENLEAYNLYLKGRHHLERWSRDGLRKSKELFQQAVALDANYALAYVGMAEAHWLEAYFGFARPREMVPRAKSAVLEALERDESLAEAHALLGTLWATYDYEWREAEREFHRALELNPALPIARDRHCMYVLRPLGRLEEGQLQVLRALQLDPLAPRYRFRLGYLFWLRGEYDEAIEHARNTVELDAGYYPGQMLLGVARAQKGEFADAIAALERAAELSGGSSTVVGLLGWVYALAGRSGEARKLLGELEAQARAGYVPPISMASIHVGLSDAERAFQWLERAVEERDPPIIGLNSEPQYDLLRSDPRYLALLRKMNLEACLPK